ncbi:MAG: hypothetical protein AOA65_0558 [Candidatus Bathyarchaeota archaeon BA1]|nr:MAG: hypothetical protein AOA65_0558 [Candidatus Bathyarchaeota archaeon BA1]
MELSELEDLAIKLGAVEKSIEGYESKRSELEKALEEYRRKRDVERHFHELAGLPYEDKSIELEEQLKKLRGEHEAALSERDRLREEILKGLSNVLIPLERESATISQREVIFPFRKGKENPTIINFIEKELGLGRPPVYVTLSPNNMKVVGVDDELSAMREVVKITEALKAKAKEQLDLILKQKGLAEEKPPVPPPPPIRVRIEEKPPSKPRLPEKPPSKAKLLDLLRK